MIICKIKSFALIVLLVFLNHSACGRETLLMKAAFCAGLQEMKQLIQKGEDVNAVDGRDFPHGGKPVLRFAIDSGCLEAVQTLFKAGANPNDFTESPLLYRDNCKANMRNLSLLSHAINSCAPISIIKELLQAGACIDGAPKICGDWSPLMIAAYKGNKEAVIVLLEAGADTSKMNSMDNKTALDYAKEVNLPVHKEIVKLLESN